MQIAESVKIMTKSEMLDYLIKYLSPHTEIPCDEGKKWLLFRSLVNVREPLPVSDDFLKIQDRLLKGLLMEKGIVNIDNLQPVKDNIYLWQGDITTLKVDAIVNAANSRMLGCFAPCHICIDNTIHTYSGVQLRLECNDIMNKQGFLEPTGSAKITKAYNLPCNYVIHTVGPIISAPLTDDDCKLLASSYKSCLELAVKYNIKSIAFCCISTGEFHFPNDKAAEIAVSTVTEFLKSNSIKVIFNVYKDIDYKIYSKLLK